MKVTAMKGETLDAICWRVLGTTEPLEQVLTLNPDLLDCPMLAEGAVVILPDDANKQKTTKPTIKLWG